MIILRDQIVFSILPGINGSILKSVLAKNFKESGEVLWVKPADRYYLTPKLSSFHRLYFKVIIITHPVEWYRQYWISKMTYGWKPEGGGIDAKCKTDSFPEFIEKALKHCSTYYQTLCGCIYDDIKEIDYVIRTENFVNDFLVSLRLGLKRNAPILEIEGLDSVFFHVYHEEYEKYNKLAQYKNGQDKKVIEANAYIIRQLF